MDKVFELKIAEYSGHCNATIFTIVCIVCDNFNDAVDRVLSPDVLSIELISVKPCLILSKNG